MVTVITKTKDLITHRSQVKTTVGLVPTMGNLHAGHISLLTRALQDNETAYLSIFVNPKQFGPNDDFHKYPRTLQKDIDLIQVCATNFPGKEVIIYAPETPDDIFPPTYNMSFAVAEFNSISEGASRPGHFDGVATVVFRLFDLMKPNQAYFGLKDYQQYLVIRQMVKDLCLPLKIVGMPILREESGLAMSSRNQYLSAEQKIKGLVISKAMKKIMDLLGGKRTNLPVAQREITALLLDKNWNYLEMRDADSLSTNITNSKRITLVGVYQLGTTRLLDNMQMELE